VISCPSPRSGDPHDEDGDAAHAVRQPVGYAITDRLCMLGA
jgi:hypothetical protein